MTWLREHGRTLSALALLGLVLAARCSVPIANAANPPLLIIVEQPAIVYAPSGERIAIPAGSEIDACPGDGALLVYELDPSVVRVPAPCAERVLFSDSFEVAPP